MQIETRDIVRRIDMMRHALSIYLRTRNYEIEHGTDSGSKDIIDHIKYSIKLYDAIGMIHLANGPLNMIIEGRWDSQFETFYCKMMHPFNPPQVR